MRNLTSKQEERLGKKKKKIAALAEIMKLNDKERNFKSTISTTTTTSMVDYGEKSSEFVQKQNQHCDEPKLKRIKLQQNEEQPPEEEEKVKVDEEDEFNINTTNTKLDETTTSSILSNNEYIELKKELKKRHSKNPPRFRLRELGECARLDVAEDQRTPIFLTDIQHLLMGALMGSESPCTPSRWCSIEKNHKLTHGVVLIVEGISLFHYFSYKRQFQQTNELFSEPLEILLPHFNETKILQELSTVPLTHSQKEFLIEKYGSLETAIEMNKDPTLMVKTIFSITDDGKNSYEELPSKANDDDCNDSFPRTKLLLSALQMVDEGYPLPLRGELAQKYSDYKFTKEKYDKVTEKSPLFGVDCEMCRTSMGINELTRISIVNESYKTVYETLVRPTNRIIDYLTKYSGITADIMMNVTKQLDEVQEEVKRLLPSDAILVGQSLNADLHAMQMMHPYVIDTSVIFNITGQRKRKTKLQILAKTFLGEVIQDKMDGHDSVEDSLASIKLTKLKLSKGLDFGDAILEGRKQQNAIKKDQLKLAQNLYACVTKLEKTTAIVTSQEISEDMKSEFEGNFSCGDNVDQDQKLAIKNSIKLYQMDGNKSAINKAREIVMENSLTITNISAAPQQLELSRIDKTISNIDKWISKMYESVAHHGLFVVLLGGSPGSSSGVAMIKIKKNA